MSNGMNPQILKIKKQNDLSIISDLNIHNIFIEKAQD